MSKPLVLFMLFFLLPCGVVLGQQITPPISRVVINGARLSDATVRALEQQYHVQIQDGVYWYDPVCGAWGFQGGPVAGYVLPGLNLGGPLRADASNGNTGVFANGRELHPYDVLALQRLVGAVYPGRYWVDARGNYGYEGGAMLGNLWALARSTGARREGILSSYDKTGVAVIGGEGL